MPEMLIPKVEKEDIKVPHLEPGESAIVLQRHEKYEEDRHSETAGSLVPEHADAASERYQTYFRELFSQDVDSETMVFFVSSDTQYAGKGHRSMETAQLAQGAAISVLEELGIEPSERIINLNLGFSIKPFDPMGLDVRPIRNLVAPKMLDVPEYVEYLRDKYGGKEGLGFDLSPKAWGVHEDDGEAEKRLELGAESVYELLERTKKSITILSRYARIFHAKNEGKKLLIWASSHYDTISPLVKDVTGADFGKYLPVDYGGGVVISLGNGEQEPHLEAQEHSIPLKLGKTATKN